MEYCPHCQKQVPVYSERSHYQEITLTRVYCMGCNRELYNYTDGEKREKGQYRAVNRRFKGGTKRY